MTRYTIAVLVNNQFGVLNRVTSMFRRRQFNINALTVSETEDERISRITIVFEGDDLHKKQMIDQLLKLPDVKNVREFTEEEAVTQELLLIKMKNERKTRNDILMCAEAFGAVTMDYTHDTMMFRICDISRRIDTFIELMRDYNILEICRTGSVAMERGCSVIAAKSK